MTFGEKLKEARKKQSINSEKTRRNDWSKAQFNK